jgi:terminase large subunit-like protein
VTAPWFETLENGTERARIDCFTKARRIGGSVAAAYRAALWAGGFELRADGTAIVREPMDVIIVSKDFPSSKRLLREVADALDDLGRLGPELDAEALATVIKLKNGRQIEALPCSDKAIRGNTAAVIGDEVAFYRHQEDVWAALKSVTDPNLKYGKGLPALLVTTPWDAGSLAHQIFTDPSFPFHRHSVDIYQAVDAGFPIDPKRAFAELGIPELIDTEYLAKWSRFGDAFFPVAKLRDICRDDLPPDWERAPVCYGIDVGGGRGRDFTACVQWRVFDEERWMTGVVAFNDLEIEAQADRLAKWIKSAPGPVRIDRGVMGLDLVSTLGNRLAGNRLAKVAGVGMMPQDQEKYATTAKRLLERDALRLYTGTECGGDENGHRALMLELSQLKTRPGVGGHLTFTTPRDPSKGHMDRAWASLIGLSGKGSGIGASSAGGYRPGVHTSDFDRSGIGMG